MSNRSYSQLRQGELCRDYRNLSALKLSQMSNSPTDWRSSGPTNASCHLVSYIPEDIRRVIAGSAKSSLFYISFGGQFPMFYGEEELDTMKTFSRWCLSCDCLACDAAYRIFSSVSLCNIPSSCSPSEPDSGDSTRLRYIQHSFTGRLPHNKATLN